MLAFVYASRFGLIRRARELLAYKNYAMIKIPPSYTMEVKPISIQTKGRVPHEELEPKIDNSNLSIESKDEVDSEGDESPNEQEISDNPEDLEVNQDNDHEDFNQDETPEDPDQHNNPEVNEDNNNPVNPEFLPEDENSDDSISDGKPNEGVSDDDNEGVVGVDNEVDSNEDVDDDSKKVVEDTISADDPTTSYIIDSLFDKLETKHQIEPTVSGMVDSSGSDTNPKVQTEDDEDDYDPEIAVPKKAVPETAGEISSGAKKVVSNPITERPRPAGLPPKPQVIPRIQPPSDYLNPNPDPSFANSPQGQFNVTDLINGQKIPNFDQVYSYNKPYKNVRDPIPLVPVNDLSRRPNITIPPTSEEEAAYQEFTEREAYYMDLQSWDGFPDNLRLFIGNLPANTISKQDLFRIFTQYGEVIQITIKAGYGFVQFRTAEACLECIKCETNVPLHNKIMRLDASRPQQSRIKTNTNSRGRERSEDAPGAKRRKIVPDCQIYVTGKSPLFFIRRVKRAFDNAQITIDTEDITHKSVDEVISEAAYSGVLATCVVKEGAVDIQTFETAPDGGVKFDEYADIEPDVAAEILTKAKQKKNGGKQPEFPKKVDHSPYAATPAPYAAPFAPNLVPYVPDSRSGNRYGNDRRSNRNHDNQRDGGKYDSYRGNQDTYHHDNSRGGGSNDNYQSNYKRRDRQDWGGREQYGEEHYGQKYNQPQYGQSQPPPNRYDSSNQYSPQPQQQSYAAQYGHLQYPPQSNQQQYPLQDNQYPPQSNQYPPQNNQYPPLNNQNQQQYPGQNLHQAQNQYPQQQAPGNPNLALALQGLDPSSVQNMINILQQQQRLGQPAASGYGQSSNYNQYGQAPSASNDQVGSLLSQLQDNSQNQAQAQPSAQELLETLARLSRK